MLLPSLAIQIGPAAEWDLAILFLQKLPFELLRDVYLSTLTHVGHVGHVAFFIAITSVR